VNATAGIICAWRGGSGDDNMPFCRKFNDRFARQLLEKMVVIKHLWRPTSDVLGRTSPA
jgi:hypothetical protein